MKVKILELIGTEWTDFEGYENMVYHVHDTSDWDDVNEEELAALTLWVNEHNKSHYPNKVVLVTEKMLDYKKTVKDYLSKAAEVKNKLVEREKKRLEAEAKRIAKQEKARETRKLKNLERKRKLLQQLQLELGENNE